MLGDPTVISAPPHAVFAFDYPARPRRSFDVDHRYPHDCAQDNALTWRDGTHPKGVSLQTFFNLISEPEIL